MLRLSQIPHDISLPSIGTWYRPGPPARNKPFVTHSCSCRSRCERTSPPWCVFGFSSCTKSTHSPVELKDGFGRTDTEEIHKNYVLIRSVFGIGLINAVLFIIYSNNFQSFPNARKYACYSGIAPFENRSGTSIRGKTRVSHLANKRLKSNLSNGARSAVQNDPELRLYYDRKAKEGKEHGVIMNAVKFKLITRVFAVVNRGTPFVRMRQAG